MPSFPNKDIQQIHYSETSAAERFNLLQKIRATAHRFSTENGEKSKSNFDKEACAHKFKIGGKVLISNDVYTCKNHPKPVKSFKHPGEIVDINDTNAKVKIGNKIKLLNINKLKLFLQEQEGEAETDLPDLVLLINLSHAKSINYKNAASLELLMLNEEQH